MPNLVYLLSLLVWEASGLAQISIEGVADRQVYRDTVSLTVSSEQGFDYTVELNGNPIPLGVSMEIDEPDYYELYVCRREQASGAEESELVRFIVRATERGNSEWGLPLWTPYPAIDSVAAEFTGARLRIVTPAEYPMGLEIPVIARVEEDSGSRLGVNGAIRAAGFPDHPLRLLRGVGSVFLPAAAEPGMISYTAEIESLQTARQITIEPSTTWETVSEDITTSIDWADNARIHISGVAGDVLTIAADATVTIGAASVVMIDPNITIDLQGKIVVNGTAERPVVITARDRSYPWGGFLLESGSSEGEFTNAILTASGADSNWFGNHPGHGSSHRKNQCLFYLSGGARVTLTDCYLVENHGQAGHGEDSYLTMTGCLVQKCITTGQYNGGAVVLRDCSLIEFPSAVAAFADDDNDALYLTGGAHSATDCLIGWALDDGIDAGSGTGGPVSVRNCWFESCYHEAMAWSEPRIADVTDTVALNCGQGIECGFGSPDVSAVHCLSTANAVGARFGDNYDWTYNGFLKVSDSLLLFNIRDVWGRAWDDWTVHLSQMDIRDNYFSAPNANHPDNLIWDPQANPAHVDELEPFLPTPADTVGIGLAVFENVFDLAQLPSKIPVRLSTFTRGSVSVAYTIYTDGRVYDSGSLEFVPGESVKQIQLTVPPPEDLKRVRVVLSNPVNAELTGYRQITYTTTYESVEPLIVEGDQWRYFKGVEEPPADWNQLLFNDTEWLVGPTGIGYDTGTDYESCIATNLSDMRNNYISVYARRLFAVEDPSRLRSLTLSTDYDDGYIAYLNGAQVDSRHAPNPPMHDQLASNHEACCGQGSCSPELIDLSDRIGDLVAGINVLAIQVHNQSLSSSDLLLIPELSAVVTPWPGDFEPDGDVDFDDFAVLAAAWLAEDGQGRYDLACDINVAADPDGLIDMLDLLVFVDNWLAGD